ncbi:DNA repair protein RecN [Thalassotalea ganghwensis]
MLVHLNIQNFAIVRALEIDWQKGMTTITGETGAGKSIAIDALGLCLGDRAVTNVVRPNSKKAELSATFDIEHNKAAKSWLAQHDLLDESDCILRRVISAEGRSKAYINGSQVPLAQLKEIGQRLINIHGQHDHQLITKATEQRNILDQYAKHGDLREAVKHYYQQHAELTREYHRLMEDKTQRDAKQQLLQYQAEELSEFAIEAGEFETLEMEYQKQSNGQHLFNETLLSVQRLSEDEQFNIVDQLRKVSDQIAEISGIDKSLLPISEQLTEALLQVDDAASELARYAEKLELDPQHYQLIEERYSQAVQLAKKHQVAPDKLYELHQQLLSELAQITSDESRISQIAEELDQVQQHYHEAAQTLSESRTKAAELLSEKITTSMQNLNMPHGQFQIRVVKVSSDKLSINGLDNVEFLTSLNPGQALEAMNKVASGGELSRISLAMQVILSANVVTPTLIFDEVDVGISGPTAAMVGKQLQLLAENTQVICVTHLPQVASKGNQQLFVAKLTDGEHTETTVTELSSDGRVQEIARLLAGDKVTQSSLANAKELLAG